MPKSKQITKKMTNSEWVRRRNKRKWARKLALRHSVLKKRVVMADTKESSKQTPLKPQNEKPKGFMRKTLEGIRSVFVGRQKNSRGVV